MQAQAERERQARSSSRLERQVAEKFGKQPRPMKHP